MRQQQHQPPPHSISLATPPYVSASDYTTMSHSNISSLPAQSFAELLASPLLDVYVGKEGKHWMLHHDLLRHHSKYFDESDLINGEERRIRDGRIELPDEDPDAFRLLLKWIYQGQLDDVSTLPREKKWDYAYDCQKLYFLCDTLGMQHLKNMAIDQFRKGCYETCLVPGADEIRPVYARTKPGSPFRKLVTKIAARQIMDPESKRDASVYFDCFKVAPEFAIDVLNAIRDGTSGFLLDDPTEGNSCRYHEHENGETCHKTVKFTEDL